MRILILILICTLSRGFSQQKNEFSVQWHDYYWNTPMIQNKYSEWPKYSIIEMQIINDYQIKVISKTTGLEKTIILRNNQSAASFQENPNLLKPILFGMRQDNTMVNIYSLNTFSTKTLSPRIKGALNPNKNYLPESIKY